LLSIGDAVVVNPGYAVCLMRRVIRFCCRCAPDRGQATLLQGICGVARICVKALPVGQLAREDVTQNLWERGLSRDRRRSRRESGLCGLPDAPRYPILLPLRARSHCSCRYPEEGALQRQHQPAQALDLAPQGLFEDAVTRLDQAEPVLRPRDAGVDQLLGQYRVQRLGQDQRGVGKF